MRDRETEIREFYCLCAIGAMEKLLRFENSIVASTRSSAGAALELEV
jgi:hypothetical protein